MSRPQMAMVSIAMALVLIFYFGFDTKSTRQKSILKSNELAGTKIEISQIEKAAKESLPASELINIQELERLAADPNQLEAMRKLSAKWYATKEYLIAGHYAEKVASLDPSGETWGIAGTTYISGINDLDQVKRMGCFNGAVRSLENAISLEPDTIRHRVNLAIAYTENPLQENPMKGIQMLLGLNERNPDNIVVLTTLARLAIKTGQHEKARERLERALEISPENPVANCLLAEVFGYLKDARAAAQEDKCKFLTLKD